MSYCDPHFGISSSVLTDLQHSQTQIIHSDSEDLVRCWEGKGGETLGSVLTSV
jgi:hypothetical protein